MVGNSNGVNDAQLSISHLFFLGDGTMSTRKRSAGMHDPHAILQLMEELSSDGSCSDFEDAFFGEDEESFEVEDGERLDEDENDTSPFSPPTHWSSNNSFLELDAPVGAG